jgi:hypothetical protein
MSGGAVFQEALRFVRKLNLPDAASADVLLVLEAGRPGPLNLLYEAAFAAELPRSLLLSRSAALYLGFCAGNLADDIVDGDCDYLEPASRRGPGIQYLLQNAFIAGLIESGVAPQTLARAARALSIGAAANQEALAVTAWSAPVYREIGERIAGRQYAAYLSLLWCGTALEPVAEELGLHLGSAAHVAEDVRSDDPRFWSMPPDDRRLIIVWAREQLAGARVHRLRFVELIAPTIESTLAGANRS